MILKKYTAIFKGINILSLIIKIPFINSKNSINSSIFTRKRCRKKSRNSKAVFQSFTIFTKLKNKLINDC